MAVKNFHKTIEPASGAIIMACGVFLFGVINAFPLLAAYGQFFTIGLLIAWLIIYKNLIKQLFNKTFFNSVIKDSVQSFAIGTWIAGTSMLCHVVIKFFPDLLRPAQIIAIMNMAIWVVFFLICLYYFKQLLTKEENRPVNGIVLLSAVSTQSVVILWHNLFFQLPAYISGMIITASLVFYIAGIWLLIKQYIINNTWSLADDWSNANCIIHGALSITGLALVTTGILNAGTMMYFWVFVLALLFFIEIIEIKRAFRRIHLYGWKEGVFTYHVSQWYRNFTFGMFYMFTLIMQTNQAHHMPAVFNRIQQIWLDVWAWIVLVMLVLELILFAVNKLAKQYYLKRKEDSYAS